MEEGLIKVTPDIEKVKSILKMVDVTLNMIQEINISKFSSNVTKEYYDVIRELMTVILLLDGYKTYGEGSHKTLIEYFEIKNKGLNKRELYLIDDLRIIRNKISYDGFFVEKNYLERKVEDINKIIIKLKNIIKEKV